MNNKVFPGKVDARWGYLLSKGDIVKFGRVRFWVNQINLQSDHTDDVLDTSKWDLCQSIIPDNITPWVFHKRTTTKMTVESAVV